MSIRISRMAFAFAVASTLVQISGGGPALSPMDRVFDARVSAASAPARAVNSTRVEAALVEFVISLDGDDCAEAALGAL